MAQPARTVGKVGKAEVQAGEAQLQQLIGDARPVAVHNRQVLQAEEGR